MTELERTHNKAMEAAWREDLPSEAVRASFEASFCGGEGDFKGWWEDANGTREVFPIHVPIWQAVGQAHVRERRAEEGMWISIRGDITPDGCTFTRNWDERRYFGTHEGAPVTPPKNQKKIYPNDEAWLEEFTIGQRRTPEHLPSWIAGSKLEDQGEVFDPNGAVPEQLAAVASTAPWGEWIRDFTLAMERFVEGQRGMVRGLREPAESIEFESMSEIIADNVPGIFFDELKQKPLAELFAAWAALSGSSAASFASSGTIAEALDAHDERAEKAFAEVTNHLDDAVEALVEARVIRS